MLPMPPMLMPMSDADHVVCCRCESLVPLHEAELAEPAPDGRPRYRCAPCAAAKDEG